MHDTLLNQFEERGYAVLDNFLSSEECDELRAAALQLAQNIPESEQKAVFSTKAKTQLVDDYFINSNDKIRYFFEKDALDENGKLKINSEDALNKIGHALHLLDPMFRCYTYSDRVRSVCRLMGLVQPAVVQSMYIFKNPGVGGEVVEHQDSTYLYTEPKPALGFWIAIDDATVQNGCLWMASGSHKSGVHRRLLRSPAAEGSALLYDRPSPVYPQSSFTPVPVTKGSCILIHGNVVHKSAHNRSENSRHAYTFHVVERCNNNFSDGNWLQEGPAAPFSNLYTTQQIV